MARPQTGAGSGAAVCVSDPAALPQEDGRSLPRAISGHRLSANWSFLDCKSEMMMMMMMMLLLIVVLVLLLLLMMMLIVVMLMVALVVVMMKVIMIQL